MRFRGSIHPGGPHLEGGPGGGHRLLGLCLRLVGGKVNIMSIIEIRNLTKRYKDSIVLTNINATFEEGLIYGLIGRNGSGKTLLLRCICGLVPVYEGQIWIGGTRVTATGSLPLDMGVIIETPGFLRNQTGFQNLKLLASIKGRITDEEIYNAIVSVGLVPDMNKKVGKYSLGMRQRLGIAQAVMENPPILLLDEPFNGLDNNGVIKMRELLLEQKMQGKTIILASHNQTDIDMLCDGVFQIDAGKMQCVK